MEIILGDTYEEFAAELLAEGKTQSEVDRIIRSLKDENEAM